jgi:putative ABC transport system substrate-binding protein
VAEPYRGVFAKILDGIDGETKDPVVRFAVGQNYNANQLADELKRRDVHVVIALGSNGLKATAGLPRDVRLIVGGVISVPQGETGAGPVFTLAPDPSLLYARLRSFMPSAKRVFVVYDPHQNEWLVRQAQEKARAEGLELVAREATDLRSAVRIYQEILASADPRTDSLWLLQDSTTVDDATILPLVLQEAWNRSLTFFSSSVAHVKRGALFALYPDMHELGRRLGDTAVAYASAHPQAASAGAMPLKDVLVAVNVRTASHLGINVDAQRHAFDLVFPEQ